MTVFVDDAGIRATVTDASTGRRYTSQWCHLFSDQIDPAELHAFAARVGLRRAWFQRGHRLDRPGVPDPAKDHYDLTANKRRQAIAAGAVPVNLDEAVSLWRAKREARP